MGTTREAATERRAAAQLRAAGMQQRGVDERRYRTQVPGVGAARSVSMPTEIRAKLERRGDKDLYHTSGYFTRYDQPYPMWDAYGPYDEMVRRGAGSKTLGSGPDVAFLVNHRGLTMARTRANTLTLEERAEGGWHDAWLNPDRTDVRDFISAVDDHLVTEMSYAFMIPDGKGRWSEDFETFEIAEYDIDRGDVSGVNYGANPYTDIAARTAEVLRDVEHLPAGALREAAHRLAQRGFQPDLERITVHRSASPTTTGSSGNVGSHGRRLQSRVARTTARFVNLSTQRSLSVADLPSARLPWYEIREAESAEGGSEGRGNEVATVYIFDEIGGSFGVDASTFAEEVGQITAPEIHVRINSPGGSVFDAITIHSTLLHHPATVRTYVDGLAASAASVIAMAADPYDAEANTGGVVMMPGSQMMIHDASALQDGNAEQMAAMSEFLHRQSGNLAGMYARRGGGDPESWRELMIAETWMFDHEAVELGLADRTFDRALDGPRTEQTEQEMATRMARTFDLSMHRYQGRRSAPAPRMRRAVGDGIGSRQPAVAEVVQQAMANAEPAPVAAETEETTGQTQMGRSITSIEALLKVEKDLPKLSSAD
jgi:ATP-dependent protease ClpP protease subunit/phage head maturation protease